MNIAKMLYKLIQDSIKLANAVNLCTALKTESLLTVGPGVSDTDFLSENPGFWPNLVQMVSISLKVTTIQIEPQMVPLGATRGHSFFYYMKFEDIFGNAELLKKIAMLAFPTGSQCKKSLMGPDGSKKSRNQFFLASFWRPFRPPFRLLNHNLFTYS